jgi:hypothetical protein
MPSPADFLVKSPGIENTKASKKKAIAAPIVTLAITDWVPRGPKADEFAPPPNTADASDLPGCNSTNMIRIKQAMIYSMVKIVSNLSASNYL